MATTRQEIADLVERTKQVFLKAGHHAYEVGLPVVRVRVMDPSRFRWRSHYKIRFACLLDISDCGKFVKIGAAYMSSDYDHRSTPVRPLIGPPVFTIGKRRRKRRTIRWVQLGWLEIQPWIMSPANSKLVVDK